MLKIISYPHFTLRHKSKAVQRVDKQLRDIVAKMLELMYESKGVGLAANQVDLPLRLFVANPTGDRDEGEEFVFINPVLSRPRGNDEKEEGCLSLPGLYGPVVRPERVHVTAYSLQGEEFTGEVDGFLARVIQHETDHLDGILFIDRMSESARMDADEALVEFELDFKSQRDVGQTASDEEIAQRLAEWEQRYC